MVRTRKTEPPATTVYLAGPMRGYEQFNFPAFHAASKDLRDRGFKVLSPAEHDEENGFDPTKNDLAGFNLEEAMRWDLQQVLNADAVVVLPGWRDSVGTNIEVQTARAVGTPVWDYPDLTPTRPEPITLEAHRLVNGARRTNYGHPYDNFVLTGKLWAPILGLDHVTPEQVALCQIGTKIARLLHDPSHRDSQVDIAGYAATYELVREFSPVQLKAVSLGQ